MPFTVEGLKNMEIHPGPFEYEHWVDEQKLFLHFGPWKLSPVCGLYNEEKEIQACAIPVMPTAIFRNEATGRERLQLEFWKYGRRRKVVVDRDVISSPNKILTLANYGIEVSTSNAGQLMKALNEIVRNSLDSMHVYTSCSHLGWCGEEFVPFSSFVVFDAESELGFMFKCIDQKGTAKEWAEYMAPLLKDTRLRLTVAAAFTSPIIEVVGQLPFIVHLWGKTGYGKTVASMIAASVWGNPAKGQYLKSLNSTPNAMLSMAAVLKNLPLVADELQTIRCSTENFDKLIMTLTEGVNRARMNRSKMEETLSWNNCFILNGEQPITGSGSGGGAVNRCIQLEVSESLMPDGEAVANFIMEHYGAVGMEFINRLDRRYVRELYRSMSGMLKKQAPLNGVESTNKQLAALALLMTGDELMKELLFGDSIPYLQSEDVLPFLNRAKEVDVAERAFEYIVNVVSANSAAFTEKSNESWGKRGPGNTVYINNTVLERELRRGGFEFSAVKRSWAESGYIKRNKRDTRLRHVINIWGVNTSCSLIVLPESEDDDNQNNRDEA